jgi:hypothetical protein
VPVGVALYDAAGELVTAGAPSRPAVTSVPDPPEVVPEPVPGYDLLDEEAALALLPTLTAEQLAAVQVYERAHHARGSVVRWSRTSSAVTSPTAAHPVTAPARAMSEGYDALDLEELRAEVARRALRPRGQTAAALRKALRDHDATAEGS